MDQIAEFFQMVGSYLGVGGLMMLAGCVLLILSRRAEPQTRPVLKWIGIPMLGCGGCLVVIPVVIVLALLALGMMMLGCVNGGC